MLPMKLENELKNLIEKKRNIWVFMFSKELEKVSDCIKQLNLYIKEEKSLNKKK